MNISKTENERKALNEYLIAVVNNSRICAHCMFNHGFCFFAFYCVQKDFSYKKEEDEDQTPLTWGRARLFTFVKCFRKNKFKIFSKKFLQSAVNLL